MKLLKYTFLICTLSLISELKGQNIDTVYAPITKDAMIKSDEPETNFGTSSSLTVQTESIQEVFTERALLYFELDSLNIPSQAYIMSAKLKLKGINHQQSGSGSNESYLQIVLDTWEENTVIWENQPLATQENQILNASPSSPTQDLEVDITNWYRLIHTGANEYPNHGFLLRLVEEEVYAKLSYHSKEAITINQPQLEIIYRIPSDLIFNLNPTMMDSDMPNAGSIGSQIIEGDAPFQYVWSSNVGSIIDQNSVNGLNAGTYTLTITDDNQQSEEKSIGLGYDPLWKLDNDNNYTYFSNTLNCNKTSTWGGIAESSSILSGTTGWIEYTVKPYTGRKMFGFGRENQSNHNNWKDIKYGLYLKSNSNLVMVASGVQYNVGDYAEGDVIRIDKNGDDFKVFKNGIALTLADRTLSFNYDLSVKTSSYDYGTKLEGLRTSFGEFLEIDFDLTALNDSLGNDGMLSVSPSHGTAPYTYIWSNGATSSQIDDLVAATYEVTVTDANGLKVKGQKIVKSIDISWNWKEEKVYDNNERVVAASKVYFDGFKNPIQTQTKLVEERMTMVNQTIYDDLGRSAISTLAAPNFTNDFEFQYDFIKASDGTNYEASKFDLPNTTSNLVGEVNNPYSLENNVKGSLGWYYSNNNNVEPHVATTGVPYSRVEFSKLSQNARRSSVPHDQLKMGSGHETENHRLPVAGELMCFFGFLEGWNIGINDTNDVQDLGSNYYKIFKDIPEFPHQKKAWKTITIDQDGKQAVVFEDLDGKVIATALSGPGDDGLDVQSWPVSSMIESTAGSYVDIHLPESSNATTLIFRKEHEDKDYTIFNLRTDEVVYENVDGQSVSLTPGFYRIVDNVGKDITTLEYTLNYHQISLNYYDHLGQLITSVSPEGFDESFDITGLNMNVSYQEEEFDYDLTEPNNWQFVNHAVHSPVTPHEIHHPITANPDPTNDMQFTNAFIYLAEKTAPPALIANDISSGQTVLLPSDPGYSAGESGTQTRSMFLGSGGKGITSVSAIGSGNNPIVHDPNDPNFDWDDYWNNQVPCGLPPTVKREYKFTFDFYAELADGSQKRLKQGAVIRAFRNYTTNYGSSLEWSFTSTDGTGTSTDAFVDGFLSRDVPGLLVFSVGQTESETIQNIKIEVVSIEAWEYNATITTQGQNTCYTTQRDPYTDYQEIENDLELRVKTLTYQLDDNNFIPSHDFAELFHYNSLGQTISTSSIDEGKTEYLYTQEGLLRFSQNEVQRNASPKRFSYTNYDNSGRIIETGEAIEGNVANLRFQNAIGNISMGSSDVPISDLTVLNTLETLALTTTEKIEPSYFVYDSKVPSGSTDPKISAIYATIPAGYSQNRLWGQLSYSWNDNNSSIYSYDSYGRVEWKVQNITGLGAKTHNFVYTNKGEVSKVIFQKDDPTEYFEHYYVYDKSSRLKKAFTRTADVGPYQKEARYYYYLHGPLKRVELANDLQGVDYVYNTLGYLKTINSPNIGSTASDKFIDPGNDGVANGFGVDAFGMELDYFSGDYTRENTYINFGGDYNDSHNGNIKAMRWNTKAQLAGGNYQWVYSYQYNKNNWLKEAQFGKYSSACQNFSSFDTPCPTGAGPSYIFNGYDDYKVDNLTYDKIGNLQTLRRRAADEVLMDDFTYNYSSTKISSLTHVTDLAPTNSLDDIENQLASNYEYDAMGRMIWDKTLNANMKLVYNNYGLVKEVQRDFGSGYLPLVTYLYDENGQRINKTTYNGTASATNKHWYLDGIDYYENLVASTNEITYELSGSSRLGSFNRASDLRIYELNDHLGNVRATISKGSLGEVDLQSYADYYPFGSEMPGRTFRSGDAYKHGYQGQFTEKDEEVNWDAFELRNWDGRLARWTNIDPANQYWSPYMGMGNNPIGMIDPDGAFSKFGAKWRNLFYGGNGVEFNKSTNEYGFYKPERGKIITSKNKNGDKVRWKTPIEISLVHHDGLSRFGDNLNNMSSNIKNSLTRYQLETTRTIGIKGSFVNGGGISFELGIGQDSYGRWFNYMTVGAEAGLNRSIGVVYNSTSQLYGNGAVSMQDFAGYSYGTSGGLSYFDGGLSHGFKDNGGSFTKASSWRSLRPTTRTRSFGLSWSPLPVRFEGGGGASRTFVNEW